MAGSCDYWLIFDADQQLVNETPTHLWQYRLDADAYYLKERSHGAYFSNIRILKVGDLWEYRGTIHESVYPNAPALERRHGDYSLGEVPDGFTSIHDNVATRTLEEDVEMLLRELEANENDTRTHFYLAKAYQGMPGRLTEALYHYSRRIQLDPDRKTGSQEIYISRLALGAVVEELYARDLLTGEHSRILRDHGIIDSAAAVSSVGDIAKLFEAASEIFKHRYEPYGHLAWLYWYQEKDAVTCYKYATKGLMDGSMGDVRTDMFTSDKSLMVLYNTKCLCGFHSRQYDDLVSACKHNLDKLRGQPVQPGTWEHDVSQVSLTVLRELENMGITD